jgi:CheY-like chemotaxis protein
MRTLKAHGFQNIITVEAKISSVEVLMKSHKFKLVILDADMKDNESFKFYLELKHKGFENLPPVLFMKEEVTEKSLEIYKKAGAVGCIKRPIVIEEFENVLEILFHIDIATENNFNLEVRAFGESMLMRVRGAMTEENLPDFIEKMTEASQNGNSLILDFSKVIKVHEHIKRIIIQCSSNFAALHKKLEIYDPKHKLSMFELENLPNIHFI